MKVDKRLRTLIENGVATNGRSVIIVVGPTSEDNVSTLHDLLKECSGKDDTSILWMHKKDGEHSRLNKKKNKTKQGVQKEIFSSANVSLTDYKDVQNVLGNTYDMCVLQNFEALTPNILAQTVETVRGGGLVLFPLSSIKSLHQLLTIKMDFHRRLKTSTDEVATPRFTERFLLTLTRCQTCLVLDDQLEVLSHSESSHCLHKIRPKGEETNTERAELKGLVSLLLDQSETSIVGPLINCCLTMDQAKAVLGMVGAITNKSNLSTVVTMAARGRGKSAALGLSIAAAVAYKFGDVFVTAPSPDNLKTVFEYVAKGLQALGYTEDDYMLVKSKHGDVCVGMEIYKERGQKVEYIRPEDHRFVTGAKIVFIDEAAAIPMTHVKEMMSARYVLMTSTVNGYEGTGRSLSHKLISDLRHRVLVQERGVEPAKEVEKIKRNVKDDFCEEGSRILHEIELASPVRYSSQDQVEGWLNSLLCLNTGGDQAARECPYPNSCDLYYVNKDTLFSGHVRTEEFLQDLISVFAASHYKNSPNDVQMLSDAPNHHVFCLLGPSAKTSGKPTIICALQVAYEGGIDEKTVESSFRRGVRGDGDLIPWIIEEKYKGRGFAQKFGVRVVRIATHPGLQRGGYGTRAMELLTKYYEGRLVELEAEEVTTQVVTAEQMAAAHSTASIERMKPRSNLHPLVVELSRRRPERMDYVGASFGLSSHLLRFWKKQGMVTIYVSLTKNALTGEFNGIVLRPINHVDDKVPDKIDDDVEVDDIVDHRDDEKKAVLPSWLMGILQDFKQRHLDMMTDVYREMSTTLALETLKNEGVEMPTNYLTKEDLGRYFSEDDDALLDGYMKDLVGEKQISTLVFVLAHLVFAGRIDLRPTELKEIVLLGMGVQRKTAEELGEDLPNTDVEERRAFYKQVIRACIMVKSGEANRDEVLEADLDKEEREAAARAEKLKLVEELEDDMEDAVELGKAKHLEMQGFRVNDLKNFSIRDGKEDIWKKEYLKIGKKSKSNILKRKAGEESEIVKRMKKSMKTTTKKRKFKRN